MNGTVAFVNANVIPMNDYERASAVYIKDGKVAAVGTDDEIRALCASGGIEPIDAGGNTILPGLYDCHAHILTTGINASGIDIFDCKDIAELMGMLKKADGEWPADRWIFGKRLDESRLAEGYPPVMKELDEIKRPVFLSDRGKHFVMVNRLAFDALGIDENMNGVMRDESGNLNGRLVDDAHEFASKTFSASWSREQRADAVRFTAELAVSRGITTIAGQEGLDSSDEDVEIMLGVRDELPIDLEIYWATSDVNNPLKAGLKCWGGDILLDGSIGSRNAAFKENFCDGDSPGYLNIPDDEVYRITRTAIENDLAVSFHCIGEVAITQALDMMQRAVSDLGERGKNAKLRLEHFGWPSDEDIVRAGEMGVRISTQSAFAYLRGGPGSVYRARLGERRERRGYPTRKLLDAGCIVGGGSDSDVTLMDSLLGIHAAVNQPYPENSVTPYEAVRMYTIDAAKCCFEEDTKGSIEVGKQGDIVMLSADPMKVDPLTIKDIKVLTTVHKGDIVYKA